MLSRSKIYSVNVTQIIQTNYFTIYLLTNTFLREGIDLEYHLKVIKV